MNFIYLALTYLVTFAAVHFHYYLFLMICFPFLLMTSQWFRSYVCNIFLWLDRGLNVWIGFGDSRESVSSRWGRLITKTWLARNGCHVLGWLSGDPNHCLNSIEPDYDHKREI